MSSLTSTESILDGLKKVVGVDGVLSSEEDRLLYSYDGTPMLRQKPLAAVIAQDVEQISKIMTLANRNKIPVVVRGAGTGLSGGSLPVENGIVLLMHRWNKLLEIDPANMTAWVQPGMRTQDFHKAVEAQGLFYPPDPGSQKICTIGGNVAENAGGLRGLKYGVTRDYVMGIEAVLANGEKVYCGGKNVKDVAGYNLRDLLIGSEGTLAVFTRILLKLIPRPAASQTILAYFENMADAAQSVSDIIAAHVVPCTMEFLDKTTIRCVEEFAHIGLPGDVAALLLLESDGHPGQVKDEVEAMSEILKKNKARDVIIARDDVHAEQLKTARRAAFSALARVKPTTILEDATVPRSRLAELVAVIEKLTAKYKLQVGLFGHAGDGNMHPTVLTDERDKEEIERVERFFDELYDATIAMGGTITGEHGVGLAKRKYLPRMVDKAALKAMRDVKKALDPNLVLNPGKVFTLENDDN